MATVFLSYRRTDSPQACRVYEWLAGRLGDDALFMDVARIPAAVDFSDHIRREISGSRVLLLLIGPGWTDRIHEEDDPVRVEIEAALAHTVPVLPVLIGNTPMPDDAELPESISAVAFRNAVTIGIAHDFHTHMRSLIVDLDRLLGNRSIEGESIGHPLLVRTACDTVIRFLEARFLERESDCKTPAFRILVAYDFERQMTGDTAVTLFLHRVRRVADSLQLHLLLSLWTHSASTEHELVGWVMSELERTPEIGHEHFEETMPGVAPPGRGLKIRRSDEDVRKIWQMVTVLPLRLSLPYVVTIELGHAD